MTLQSSGPISLSQIRTEFGGSAPDSLSEYYAGGAYVPSGTTGVNGAVPSSGTIGLHHFLGTSATDIQTVTNGNNGGGKYGTFRGYTSGSFGSISDGTMNLLGGATITSLWTGGSLNLLQLVVAGTYPNSGWNKLTISGVDYLIGSASYDSSSGTSTSWTWSTTNDPFNTTTTLVYIT